MTFAETPRTDAGNATFMANGNNLENFSVENSLLSPVKRKDTRDDLLAQMRNGRGHTSLKTPRARVPLADRRNLSSVSGRQEFTPLLHSVTKKNFERKGRLNVGPETPAFLRGSMQHSDSPALPGMETSVLYGSELGSSLVGDGNGTSMPQVASSSAQSTPLAVLPNRDAAGALNEQGNLMTLREQENIINKIEKENFGLKLKIHFLEESLQKSGPGFNEAALKENTDLKVDRLTLQRELSRCKKLLSQAERDAATLRRHVEEAQEKARQRHMDVKLKAELETLKHDLADKETEVEEMRVQMDTAERHSDDVEKLRADIEDLEVDLREKDRLIDERDDEIDNLNAQTKKYVDDADGVEAELDAAKKKIEEFEEGKDLVASSAEKLEEMQEELREAIEAKERAEADLDELRDEMSNKSINTKGLSRQLEEKASKLQDDLADLRSRHTHLQEDLEDKNRGIRRLQEELQEKDQDADVRDQRLKDQNELLRNENGALTRKCESLTDQTQRAVQALQEMSEKKDLLHSRHDALTIESQTLQKDLIKARSRIEELEQDLSEERQHAQDNERQLREEAKDEMGRLSKEIDDLRRKVEDKESRAAVDKDHWEGKRKGLESQKERLEQQTASLQRTVSKLHETEGTLSGRESQLQQALDSEKQRHQDEEAAFKHQVEDLNAVVEEKRQALDDIRDDLSQAREDLRISQRDQADLEEKIQALEDEIDVLQTEVDEDADKVKDNLDEVEQEAGSLRSQLAAARDQLHQGRDDEAKKQQATIDDLGARVRDTDSALQQIRRERQSLRDEAATNSLDIHKLHTAVAETEAERDELRSQIKHMEGQVDETFKLDQEKLELRSSKLKLDNEVVRLRKEQKSLSEKNDSIERILEDEISRAGAEEARLNSELADLQRKLLSALGSRERDSNAAKQQVQRLEARISELECRPANLDDLVRDSPDLSTLQKDLSIARRKETAYAQREIAQKEIVRDLKQKVGRLERQVHEAEIAQATVESPKSSVGGSARKSELVELRRQLIDAHQELKNVRTKSRDDIIPIREKLLSSEKQNQESIDAREILEANLSRAQHERASIETANAASTATISRLGTRISSLESELRNHRRSTIADDTIAEERKDLHDLLKDSKLQVEDLQLQILARESSMAAAATREKDLRSQLKRVREERSLQVERSRALGTELDGLQTRYKGTLETLSRHQRAWEDERKAMARRVRFPNTSISELHASERELEKKHVGELRGLAKQIQWLRAKLQREGAFREGLIYEKRFLLIRIGMFEACNATDLQLLSEMGVNSQTDPTASTRLRLGDAIRGTTRGLSDKKSTSIRTVALAIIASIRMKNAAGEWAVQRKVREALGKKLEGIVKRRRSSHMDI